MVGLFSGRGLLMKMVWLILGRDFASENAVLEGM